MPSAYAQGAPAKSAPERALPLDGTVITEADAPPPEKPRKKRDLLIAPVPFSTPTTGVGIAVGAVAFYNPNHAPHQWASGGGVVWTSLGTKGVAAFHSMSLDADRFRISAIASYFDAREKFYGIGADAGDRGEPLELANKKLNIQLQGQMRVFQHGYIGARYRLVTTDARPNEAIAGTAPPPAAQLNSTISMVGPQFAFDTRDSQTQPHHGVNLSGAWIFGTRAFGDSFEHNKLALSGSAYFPFGTKTVFATNATLCSAGGNVPYNDLCLYGSGAALRGYINGRYRDRASWTVQGELRQHIAERWGATAFFGFGGIAPSVGDFLGNGTVLPGAGLGVRYQPFKDNDVHLRLDLAIGKNESGVYVGIGEAF
ncbi:MAG TPA: BamA/TamA family outer membrane protein [Sphingobium sp.]|uniref:BamA/TamA family outer membrane protein n=1 Tax=Sphingobium sp. TaxID=1912891 RepID=UPI002ED2ABCB